METCGKLTLSAATVNFSVKCNVFAFKASGILTRDAMSKFEECLSTHRAHYSVIFADYSDAVVAFSLESKWDNHLADIVAGVLIRPDQREQLLEIAQERAKTGNLWRLFTDAYQCVTWAQKQASRPWVAQPV